MIAYISQVSLLISLKDTELHLHGKSKPTYSGQCALKSRPNTRTNQLR